MPSPARYRHSLPGLAVVALSGAAVVIGWLTLPKPPLLDGVDFSTRLPLRAETDTGVRRIYWFADKSFLGACDAREVLSWKATPGIYELTAVDDHGRSGSRVVSLQ